MLISTASRTRPRGQPSPTTSQARSPIGSTANAALYAALLEATRAAALACQYQLGRGDPLVADAAATNAIRDVLASAPGCGVVVTGEDEKDQAPRLFNGEQLGGGSGPALRWRSTRSREPNCTPPGRQGALLRSPARPDGELCSPGPGFYMDKLVVGESARGQLDITRPVEKNCARSPAHWGSRCLGCGW
jgi:fructose-1,6-bisphosphatase II